MNSPIIATGLSNRIQSLDLLRGFALLGILIMNVISFSNIGRGYINPTAGAGIEGLDGWLHGFGYIFADMRFKSIFSMLFGAGLVLFSERIVMKDLSAWKYHYRRMFLLLCFGMIHAYLIWMGDILVPYAICGSIVFLIRKWKLRGLKILAIILFSVPIIFSFLTFIMTPAEMLDEIFSFWTPTQMEIDTETVAYLGGWLQQMDARIPGAIELQTLLFLMEQMWHVLAMMIVGILLSRSGFLSGEKSKAIYRKSFLLCLFVGLVLSSFALWQSYQMDWDGAWVMNVGHQFNYIASFFMAMAYISIVVLWSKSNSAAWLKAAFQSVGRMAFTNYIGSSIICTFIFYGHGLGYFGTFDRLEMWYLVIAVWIFLLLFSSFYMKRFKQGPLEWLWRKGTYLK